MSAPPAAHGEDNAEKSVPVMNIAAHVISKGGRKSAKCYIHYKRKQHCTPSRDKVHNGAVPGKHNVALGKQAMRALARGPLKERAGNCRHRPNTGKAGVNAGETADSGPGYRRVL